MSDFYVSPTWLVLFVTDKLEFLVEMLKVKIGPQPMTIF
jgi:hypothetical protein